ncbi:MAG: hypothetical protein MK101_00660 [Phycisphaerales bacterium]|nr:hypothetical protein [Phycisphaerales bacterium]
MTEQPKVSLPRNALLQADVAGLVAGGLLGAGGGLLAGQDMTWALSAALGSAITGVVAMVGTGLIRPQQERPVLLWANLLIALASGRLVVSVGACLLLYFAAQLPVAALLTGMLLTLVIVLITETRIAAARFSKATPAASKTDQSES